MAFTTVAEAVAWIEQIPVLHVAAHEPQVFAERQTARLAELRALLARLGDPQARLRSAHITGTSGKGSTATLLDAVLRAAGRRVGLYTNPYVRFPLERIQIDGAPIADEAFLRAANDVAAAALAFPGWTTHVKQRWVAVTLLACAQAGVDDAVIEVGMGGRYDETNLITPAVAVITTIGLDHTEFLGPTVADIAWHKAGIIKAGALAVTAATQPDALAAIRAEAAATGAPLAVLGMDFTVAGTQTGPDGTRFSYADDAWQLDDLWTPLVGAHQAINAALAIRATRALEPGIAPAAIRAGLAAAWLPGRFEVVGRRPLVVLDVAHNPDKIAAFARTLRAAAQWERLWIVFGALESKATGPMFAALAPLDPAIVATAPDVTWRAAATPERIAREAADAGLRVAATVPQAADAVRQALALAGPDDVVAVTGSLFLVSQVRGLWPAARS